MYLGNKESIETGMRDKPRVNLLWALNIFSGLSRRLKNQGLKPTHSIDVVAVKIRNITKGDKLYTTKVVAGPREMTVVTNLEGLATGDTLRAALLPPAQVGGIWSEAMFLGDEKVEVESGTLLDPAEFDTKEADGILVNELKG
jgi:predicted RNA-binding protein with EMAP domain